MRKEIEDSDVDLASTESLLSFVTGKLSDWSESKDVEDPNVTIKHLKDFFSKKENPLRKPKNLSDLSTGLKKKLIGNNKVIDSLIGSISLSNYGMHKKGAAPSIYCITGVESSGKSFFCSTLKDSLEKSGINVLNYSGVHFSDEFAKFKVLPEVMNNTSLCEKINIHPNSAKIFVTSGVENAVSMGFNSEEDSPTSSIFKELLSLVDCNLVLNEVRKKDIFRILYHKLQKINEDLRLSDIEVVFTLSFLKEFARSSKNLVDFQDRFDNQINKFICQELTGNASKINLAEMSFLS